MKNYAVYAKSKGILAFANNSPTVDYVAIATQTLQLAQQILKLPVHLVTGQRNDNWRNTRYDIDLEKTVLWNNYDRHDAWNQTPFDQTVVIDVDYLVTTQDLKMLFDTTQDLIFCHRNDFLHRATLPVLSIKPVWATVFYFRKTPRTKLFFDLVARIQNNYEFYKILFGIKDNRFRNDYAFAMAEIIFNGGTETTQSRWYKGITTVDHADPDIEINQDWIVARSVDYADVLPRQDLHVMSKAWLQSSKLNKFIKDALK